jgi:hypothetical protein
MSHHHLCPPLHTGTCRQGLKEYSNWPTYPQLYVGGELIGGCDIVLEMQQSGELRTLLQEKAPSALMTQQVGGVGWFRWSGAEWARGV